MPLGAITAAQPPPTSVLSSSGSVAPPHYVSATAAAGGHARSPPALQITALRIFEHSVVSKARGLIVKRGLMQLRNTQHRDAADGSRAGGGRAAAGGGKQDSSPLSSDSSTPPAPAGSPDRGQTQNAAVATLSSAFSPLTPASSSDQPVTAAAAPPASVSHSVSPVLIKMFASPQPSDEQVTRMRFELMAFQRLTGDVGRPLALVSHEEAGLCLLYEDCGGTTLDGQQYGYGRAQAEMEQRAEAEQAAASACSSPALLPSASSVAASGSPCLPLSQSPRRSKKRFRPLSCLLHAARSLCSTLMLLHEHGVVYKSLRPATVLFNEQTQRCLLLELNASSLLSREKAVIQDWPEDADAAQLAYISPEQTGRMNRVLDSRSDLYSLGIVLYELMVGQPPFASSDPMETIHFHLAKSCPDPVQQLAQSRSSAGLPLPSLDWREREALGWLGAIVSKCVHKQAEDRYQSAAGLRADIDHCLQLLSSPAAAAAHQPGVAPQRSLSPLIAVRSLTPDPQSLSPSAAGASTSPVPGRRSLMLSPAPSPGPSPSPTDFPVGRTDVLSQFRISQKLYGREEQVKVLLDAFSRISGEAAEPHTPSGSSVARSSSGNSSPLPARSISPSAAAALRSPRPELVLVAGYSGIGKTSVVDEVQKPIVRRRGLFIRAKYELYRRSQTVLFLAFQPLLLQLLTQDVTVWRERLLHALDGNGALLTDVVPELELLIGPQPPVPLLPATDSENRFVRTFLSFVLVFAQPEHPLAVFIDDLQWSDTVSLRLLRALFQLESANLLLIGAYRDNETSALHPLLRMLEELQTEGSGQQRIHSIVLQPLSLQDVVLLVSDSLRCSEQAAAELSRLLMTRTRGNPFFISSILQSFYNDGLIVFDYAAGCWSWSMDALRLAHISDDVVDLLCSQMLRMDDRQQQVLKLAACIGSTFDLHSLSLVADAGHEQTVWELWTLNNTGLLIPLHSQYDLFVLSEHFRLAREGEDADTRPLSLPAPSSPLASSSSLLQPFSATVSPADLLSPASPARPVPSVLPFFNASKVLFRFAHDRIHQAANSLLSPAERQQIHLRIARLLHRQSELPDAQVVDVMQHYMQGAVQTAVKYQRELRSIIQLALRAAKKARQSNAYSPAAEYLQVARALLHELRPTEEEEAREPQDSEQAGQAGGDAHWLVEYATSVAVHVQLAESLLLNSQLDEAGALVAAALPHVHTVFDQVALLEVQQTISKASGNMVAAAETGVQCLLLLNYTLASIDEVRQLAHDSERVFQEFERIVTGQEMQEQYDRVLFNVLVNLTPCAVFVSSPSFFLFSSVAHGMVQYSAEHGICISTAFALSTYSHILWGEQQPHLAYKAGEMAMRMLSRTQAPESVRAKVQTTYYGCIAFWMQPLATAWQGLYDNADLCDNNGDFEFSSYCRTYAQSLQLADGQPLERVARRQREMLGLFAKTRNIYAKQYCLMYTFVVAKLRGELPAEAESMTVGADSVHLQSMLEEQKRGKLSMYLFANLTCQTLLYYYMRDWTRALSSGEEGWQVFLHQGHSGAAGLISNVRMLMYYALALLATAPCLETKDDASGPDTLDGILAFHQQRTRGQDAEASPDPRTERSAPSSSAQSQLSRGLSVHVDGAGSSGGEAAARDPAFILRRVGEVQHYMSLWAKYNPVNFLNKVRLIEAERVRVFIFGHPQAASTGPRLDLLSDALRLYEEAISLSRLNGFMQEEALANELCGRFCLQLRLRREAEHRLRLACSGWTQYGCAVKQEELRAVIHAEFPQLPLSTALHGSERGEGVDTVLPLNISLSMPADAAAAASSVSVSAPPPSPPGSFPLSAPAASSHPSTAPVLAGGLTASSLVSDLASLSSSSSLISPSPSASAPVGPSSWDQVDMGAVMKACMAFSVETDLAKLTRSLLWLVIQTAGASRGTLLLKQETEQWSVELAVSVDDKDEAAAASSVSYPHCDIASAMPLSLFNLVSSTHQSVLLSGAELRVGVFATDPALQRQRPKACLCVPILQHGQLTGLLYLVNFHTADSFTRTHLHILSVLAGQAALSIENARLYARLEQRSAELQRNNEQLRQEMLERQQAQEAMKKAKEAAEKAAETKSAFLTPMNAVLGLARLMLDTELSPEQSQYLSMITNSGKLLLTIISDVLDFSRIEENRLELEYRRFSLLDCCENAIHLVHDMANSKSIDLAYSVERSTPSHIYGDSSRLQQVLLNLLSNACKFTPSHGQIFVSLRCHFLDPSAVQQLAQSAAAQAQAQSPFLDSPASAAGSNSSAAQAADARARAGVAGAGSAAASSAVRRIVSSTPQPAPSRRLQLASAASASSLSPSAASTPVPGDDGGLSGISGPSKSASSSPIHTPSAAPSALHSSFTPPYRQYVELEFSVRDTGLGMSEETQSRLFKSFSQGDSSVVRRFGGTGLGLAISKRLAMAMHGRMWCQSRVGEGSTFFFTIQSAVASPQPGRRRLVNAEAAAREQQQPAPFALSPLASPAPSPPAAARSALSLPSLLPNVHRLSEVELLRLSQKRVLLVSDLPASRDAMFQLLTAYELQVQTAASIREAAELAAAASVPLPHSFILDYRGCSVHSQQQVDAVDRMVRAFMAASRQPAVAPAEVAQQTSSGGEKQQKQEEEKQQDERQQAAATAGSPAAPQSSAFTFSFVSPHVADTGAAPASLPSSSAPSASPWSPASSPLPPVVLFLTARQAASADDQAGVVDWGSSIKPTATGGQADDDDKDDDDEDDAAASQPEGELSSDDEAAGDATVKERADRARNGEREERKLDNLEVKAVATGDAAAGSLVPRGGHEADIINHLVLARLSNLEQQQTEKKERKSRRQPQSQQPAAVKPGSRSTLAKAVELQSLSSADPLRPADLAAVYAAFELAKPFHQADLLHTLAEHLPQDDAAGDGSTAVFIRRWDNQRAASTASTSGSDRSHELSPTSAGDDELGNGWDQRQREKSDPTSAAAEAAGSDASTAASLLRKGGASSRALQAHSQLAALKAGLHSSLTQPNGIDATHAAPPAQPGSASPPLSAGSSSSSTAAAVSSSSSSLPSRAVVKATSRQGQQQRQLIRAIAAEYPMRVLLAEDNPVNQKMMRMVLRKLGYEADVASNGLEVLQAVRERAAAAACDCYDCILMDVNMPDMDGLQATAALRADSSLPAACQPHIIALTANVMQADRDRCRQAGMQDFLSKPITLEPLTQALKAAFHARHTA